MSGIAITIFDTYVRVPNGLGSFKNISLEDFISEIKRLADNGAVRNVTGTAFRFPNEVLTAEISPSECRLLMYFPADKREVKHIPRGGKQSTYTVPFPPTIIKVTLKADANRRWVVDQVLWYCTDMSMDEVPNVQGLDMTPTNRIWPLPFPNQYGDGRMCTGGNSFRTLYDKDLRGLNELFYGVLLASPFNDDLGININQRMEPVKWFSKLSKLDAFPFQYLRGHADSDEDEEEDED